MVQSEWSRHGQCQLRKDNAALLHPCASDCSSPLTATRIAVAVCDRRVGDSSGRRVCPRQLCEPAACSLLTAPALATQSHRRVQSLTTDTSTQPHRFNSKVSKMTHGHHWEWECSRGAVLSHSATARRCRYSDRLGHCDCSCGASDYITSPLSNSRWHRLAAVRSRRRVRARPAVAAHRALAHRAGPPNRPQHRKQQPRLSHSDRT